VPAPFIMERRKYGSTFVSQTMAARGSRATLAALTTFQLTYVNNASENDSKLFVPLRNYNGRI
jgi:hypothetical protein